MSVGSVREISVSMPEKLSQRWKVSRNVRLDRDRSDRWSSDRALRRFASRRVSDNNRTRLNAEFFANPYARCPEKPRMEDNWTDLNDCSRCRSARLRKRILGEKKEDPTNFRGQPVFFSRSDSWKLNNFHDWQVQVIQEGQLQVFF